jgi:hypothetical protein
MMRNYVHLVFSEPPLGVSDAEYNKWYDEHVQEILAVDGWEAVTRYSVSVVVGEGELPKFGYLALYELSCHPAIATTNLESANLGSSDSYLELQDSGQGKLPLPDWFAGVVFGSWNCVLVTERVTPNNCD